MTEVKDLCRLAALFLAVLVCGTGASRAWAEAEDAPGAWPALNEAGYLDSGEFVYEDPDAGLWRYCSETLRIEVVRKTETDPVKLVWYDAEVWSRQETFGLVTNKPGEYFTNADWPAVVCSKNGAVLAINGDFACHRWPKLRSKKERNNVGIIIRDGEIKSEYTVKAVNTGVPNLDTLVLYPDGNMEVYNCNDLTAQEYIDKGARDVLAFGPWLLRDGEFNSLLPKYESKYKNYRAPRTAIGMIEPGHYIAIMAEGRLKDSKGITMTHLAEKMKERGCVCALNMDGGMTSCIMFMGKQICQVEKKNKNGSARKQTEFLAIGTSLLVEGYLPPEER